MVAVRHLKKIGSLSSTGSMCRPKFATSAWYYEVSTSAPPYLVAQFDMETGKELARKIVNQPVTDVCSVKFD